MSHSSLVQDLALIEAGLPLPGFTTTASTKTQADVIAKAEAIAREQLMKQERAAMNRLQKAYRQTAADIKRQLRMIMGKYPKGRWDIGAAIRYRDLGRTHEFIRSRMEDLNFTGVRGLEDDLVVAFKKVSNISAYQLDVATPPDIGISFGTPSERMVRGILDQPFEGVRFSQKWGRVTNQVAMDAQAALTQSVLQGESIRDAAKRIDDVMVGGMSRAENIARTELMRASTLAKDSIYQQNRGVMDREHMKEWINTDDARLCVFCETIVANERYRLSDASGKFLLPDGRTVTGPPAHNRCRCTDAPRTVPWNDLIPGMEAPEGDIDVRMIRNPKTGKNEIVPLAQWEEWATEHGLSREGM